MKCLQQGMALFLSWCLLIMSVRDGYAYQADPSLSQAPPQAAEQSPELDLSRFLRQLVKTHISANGELCHGIVSTNVHA